MTANNPKSINRRTFMQHSSQGAFTLAALSSAPTVLASQSPNEVIGVGHIGVGVRGTQLVQEVAGDPERGRPGITNTQIRASSDIYQPHMEKGIRMSGNPSAKRYPNYQDML